MRRWIVIEGKGETRERVSALFCLFVFNLIQRIYIPSPQVLLSRT